MKKIIIMLAAIFLMAANSKSFAQEKLDPVQVKAILDKLKSQRDAARDSLKKEMDFKARAFHRVALLSKTNDSLLNLKSVPMQKSSSSCCDTAYATIERMQRAYSVLYEKYALAHLEVEHVSDPIVEKTIPILWKGKKSAIPKPGTNVTGTVAGGDEKKTVKHK